MARSLHAIVFDFQKALRESRELDQVAQRLNSLSDSSLEDTLNQISANWTGDNAVKYIKKGKLLQGNIDKTANALREVAEAIREIARNLYEAEMAAWERAHNRD